MNLVAPLSLAALGLSSIGLMVLDREQQSAQRGPVAVVGDPDVVGARYEAWKAARPPGTERNASFALAWSRALSTERTTARGAFRFDAATGLANVYLEGLSATSEYDAWLVDNAPGGTAAPEAGDRFGYLGALEPLAGRADLDVDLAERGLDGFDVDLVVVARRGLTPDASVVLGGFPSVFERIASRELAPIGVTRSGVVLARAPSSQGGGTPPAPPAPPPGGGYWNDLIAKGEEFFFHETFSGNGRTCGTCHPAENNFTIEPAFIATLPPTDPLFVAEFNPDLNFDLNGGLRFENPILMRQFGVIVENLDGFDDLRYRFTMRSVSHTLGMSQSITSPDGPGVVPEQRTGWSGDGAPGQGTLREFALGAVRQHFTRTMGRVPGVDFIFPDDDQLDAMEAFQLSLGRQAELDLNTLSLINPEADEGRVRFDALSCNRCHENAGANRGGANFNFATGVDAFARNHPDGTGELRPPDGGLGTNGAGNTNTIEETPEPDDPNVFSFGNKTFNTQSLVEFADTVPGFHNNITNMGSLDDTVEGAISFYRSAEFETSPDGFTIGFSGNDIENIGKFLRVINALENRRSSDQYGQRAVDLITPGGFDPAVVERVLRLAQADAEDGAQVLSQVSIHLDDAVRFFKRAIKFFELAKTGSDASRLSNIATARSLLDLARTSMEN